MRIRVAIPTVQRPPSAVHWLRSAAAAALLFVDAATSAPAPEPVPVRIVSLAPHLTELAFDVGAGDRIVASVEYSDYPAAARDIPRIGDAFRVDLERLLALRPDIVLAWQSGTPRATIERIRALRLPVRTIETQSLADVAQALRTIGTIAGTADRAERAAVRFEREIAALRAEFGKRRVLSVFVEIDDEPLYTVNGRHVMSEIVALCGGRNVFAQLDDLAPAIGIEAVIAANPQVILSTDDTVPDAMAAWRRWQHIEAVRTGNVYSLRSDDIARATTRLAQGTREVCRTMDLARMRTESRSQ